MGFFSDLKEDLKNQGAGDRTPGSERTQAKPAKGDALKELQELEATLQDIDELQEADAEAAEQEEQRLKETESLDEAITDEPAIEFLDDFEEDEPEAQEESSLQISLEEPAQEFVPKAEPAAPAVNQDWRSEGEVTVKDYEQSEAISKNNDKTWVLDLNSVDEIEETAVITAGMRIKGDILSTGSADVFGEVFGNVQVKGKLNVTGRIAGNSKAAEILADSAKINGDVLSDGAVRIGMGTVVVGNVEGTDAVIAGAVKGTIDVKGPVIIDSTAVVLGNVKAKTIQINNGARIEGMCVLSYAEQSAAKFFEEQEA